MCAPWDMPGACEFSGPEIGRRLSTRASESPAHGGLTELPTMIPVTLGTETGQNPGQTRFL